jgi:hypothetical protein
MQTLFDFLTFTKGWTYVTAGICLVAFIPFWRFLTDREKKS